MNPPMSRNALLYIEQKSAKGNTVTDAITPLPQTSMGDKQQKEREARLQRRKLSTLLLFIGFQPAFRIDLGALWVERSDALRLDAQIALEKSD